MSESNKPKATTNLSIGYHNIEGKHSFLHGCKLNNHLNFINDIEILAETWAECDNCKNNIVINYSLLKAIEPQKTKGCKKGRKSGGILLYCKSYLKPFIKILKSCPTHIWFEIDKNLFYNIPKNVRYAPCILPQNHQTTTQTSRTSDVALNISNINFLGHRAKNYYKKREK